MSIKINKTIRVLYKIADTDLVQTSNLTGPRYIKTAMEFCRSSKHLEYNLDGYKVLLTRPVNGAALLQIRQNICFKFAYLGSG